jgi:hypothetical protein
LSRLVGRTPRERLITALTTGAIAVAAVAAIVLLGGDGDEYLEQADAICLESKQALAEVGRQAPDSRGGPGTALRLRTVAAAEIVAEWRSRLAALDPPSDREQAAAQLDQALAELELHAREAAVARAGGGSAAGGSRLSTVGARTDAAIKELDLEECSDAPLDLPGEGA